ncbi:P-loop containing nucleoside triphosphate hydrolase protein [Hypoxylon sp. FL1150]|nr:P-loop containing nucleoside triphosphate hydrolase protein [Hypoxylon sp. FL1150]
MFRGVGSDGDSHIYGFPNRIGRDRHAQNIIDHTNTLLPDFNHRLPRFNSEYGVLADPYGSQGIDDQDLDDFDRIVLGRPQRSSYISSSDYHEQRLSLPPFHTPNQQQRVVGDASHHFRQSTPRGLDFPSPFSDDITHVRRIEPSPASQSLFRRERPQRLGELQPGIQTATPPFYNALNPTPAHDNSVSSSSPSNLGASSPSTRLSLQRNAKFTENPLVTHKSASNLRLDLEHAPNGPPVVRSTRLVDPRQALPDKFRNVFPYELFNVVQSKCFPLVYGTNDNVVVSAPTGCGKTAILEMAICKLTMSPGSENFKIVYQAPTKSLCSERARDWEKKFSHMNLGCIELTGDTSQIQASRVGSASIIVTTPEKWDSITRKWSDHRKLLEMIRLVLIDEVHILKDVRGATLEAVVSRMKTIGANIRFVALSATVPNIGDVARWLGRDHSNTLEPARTESFGEELRPVKLQRYVYGYPSGQNDFIFDKTLDGKLTMLLAKHTQKKPIMVFCFTRKSCEQTAQKLAEWWSSSRTEDRVWPAPTKRVPVINRELQEIVRYGVAFHHAGLDTQDRTAVAQNFLDGQIYVICCTSTLAVGVNLPCHTVVLKGTTGHANAGRPQFDDSAVAIIMTKAGNVDRYKKMMSGNETLESTLHRNLVEHLNSEISLGTIQDVETAKKWIGGTFLSVRVRQSPLLYLEGARNAEDADKTMEDWCEKDIKLLQQDGLITETVPFKCTEYGHAMSRYMVKFETMELLLSIPRGAGLEEILRTLCTASEFKDLRFKSDERALFRELNKSPFILHRIKETVTETWHKIFLIIQVHLGCVELPNEKGINSFRYRIATDKAIIFDRLNRLVRCFVDCRAFDNDGFSTKAGLELARALAANSWENRPSQLSQIPGSGPVTVRKWVSHGVHTVLSLADRDFQEIERITSRNPPYGMNLLKTLEKFPRLAMSTRLIIRAAHRLQPEDKVTVTLKVNLGYRSTKGLPTWNNTVPAVTFMVLTTDGNLACFWRGNLKRIDKTTGLDLEFPVMLSAPGQEIFCYFSCEEIVGTQVTKVLRPDVPEAAFRKPIQPTHNQTQVTSSLDDDMDYEEVPDEDMLDAVLSSTEQGDETHQAKHLSTVVEDVHIANTVSTQDEPSLAPTKMANGRWMCNHRCRNGGPTTTGKPCNHKCCHEGVEKLRMARPKKGDNKNTGDNQATQGSSSAELLAQYLETSQTAVNRPKRNQQAEPETATIYESLDGNGRKVPAKRGQAEPTSNMKRKRLAYVDDDDTMPVKRRINDSEALSDIECIDLTMTPENEQAEQQSLTSHDFKEKTKARKVLQKVTSSSPVLRTSENGSPSHPIVDCDEAAKRIKELDATGRDHTQTKSTDDDLDDDLDDDEFPDLDTIIQSSRSRNDSTSQSRVGDETLYPGVVQTLKESMDYG